MTQDELQVLCEWWQKTLRLQDWDVKTAVKRERDFDLDDSVAEIHMTLSTKRATMLLLDPIDYPTDTEFEQDHEQELCHELLHLHFEPFMSRDRTSLQYIAQEQAIDSIAKALVSLKRKGESHAVQA